MLLRLMLFVGCLSSLPVFGSLAAQVTVRQRVDTVRVRQADQMRSDDSRWQFRGDTVLWIGEIQERGSSRMVPDTIVGLLTPDTVYVLGPGGPRPMDPRIAGVFRHARLLNHVEQRLRETGDIPPGKK